MDEIEDGYVTDFKPKSSSYETLRGLQDKNYDDVVKFLGIFYADKPVRFAAPVMKDFEGDVLDGTRRGANCMGGR